MKNQNQVNEDNNTLTNRASSPSPAPVRHSLAPWRAQERLSGSENHKGWLIFSGLNGVVAEVYPLNEDPTPDAKGNARLIAAAPALLEAAKFALSVIESLPPMELSETMAEDKLSAAIASAEGNRE